MAELGRAICGDLQAGLAREWLVTNGVGGYASGTVAGPHTRRYHGLLVASLRPPTRRFVLLSRMEDALLLGDRRVELSANLYPGAVHPQGFRHLDRFLPEPCPTFEYRVDGVVLRRSISMPQGENTTVIRYELCGDLDAVGLEIRPLLAFRDYHSLTHENDALDPTVVQAPGLATVRPYDGLPPLHLAHDAMSVDPTGFWFRSFQYPAEGERGLDCSEDLFSPLALSWELRRGEAATCIASLTRRSAAEGAALMEQETRRRRFISLPCRHSGGSPSAPMPLLKADWCKALARAADQFLARRGEGQTVIAGLHWFTDWGRDTMISLPGLTLVTGRYEAARAILMEFVGHLDRGLLPNRFPDDGEEPEYNTVDATLWLFEATAALRRYTGDREWIREHLYAPLVDVVDWHVRGTRHGIKLDRDGLLRSGAPGLQLTWMDARVNGQEVTPRHGKPVEIQALWYNALRVLEALAEEFGDASTSGRCGELAAKTRAAFARLFWNEAAGCLYDVVDDHGPDPSIRPNQVLAAALSYPILSRARTSAMLRTVREHLLTPRGLRSLSPADPRYRGRCEGDAAARDGAYHQGTVWPWLMGPFISALVRSRKSGPSARREAAELLRPLQEHLLEAGIGQVSEIFDGDPPHAPRGCIAQAWSVAELLRASVEDILAVAPGAGP